MEKNNLSALPAYAIIDIETTGLSPRSEKITEIAIIIHDGQKEIERYSTLLNPEKKISYRITRITGINNKMVEEAPKFYEVAKKIVELTENKIFVGHNVRFDYGFIRNEFLSLGYDYKRRTLDTIKLARKLIPGQPSYGLGKLCKSLNIENHDRHRAMGDAMATTRLFEMLLAIDQHPENINLKGVQSDLSKSLLKDLPPKAGVYYFYNNRGELIYVGKSVNIHDRVLSHLNNNLHKKAIEMKSTIADVKYEITGSELIALLLESSEIKKHQPLYNRAQRRTFFNYGLYSFYDEQGYLNLKLMRILSELNPIYTYSSLQEGKEHMERLCDEYELCQKLCGLYDNAGPCFYFQINKCQGACAGEESVEDYNSRVNSALNNFHFERQNFFVIDKGRVEKEVGIVKIENGKYCGFGYCDENEMDVGIMHDNIKSYNDNKEVRQLIKSFVRRKKCKVLEF
jgi:DNA polymerase-3 subunit epsilon